MLQRRVRTDRVMEVLLQRFLQLYPDLRERLRRRLGSTDLADEALNEVYVKLRRAGKPDAIRNIGAYLFRLTLNTASDQRRAGEKLASASEIEAALDISDPSPDASRTVAARHDLAILQEAIAALPERRRAILLAVRLDDRSCREIADEMGVSKRTVELELRQALDHCAERLARASGHDFAIDPPEASYN